ncbi:hypothetical protein EPN28_00865 [Patescibacteria group bacterium]|nr:MAG: hypothetical protein EPN28_00865 [Patescibacteria group bacterium]
MNGESGDIFHAGILDEINRNETLDNVDKQILLKIDQKNGPITLFELAKWTEEEIEAGALALAAAEWTEAQARQNQTHLKRQKKAVEKGTSLAQRINQQEIAIEHEAGQIVDRIHAMVSRIQLGSRPKKKLSN